MSKFAGFVTHCFPQKLRLRFSGRGIPRGQWIPAKWKSWGGKGGVPWKALQDFPEKNNLLYIYIYLYSINPVDLYCNHYLYLLFPTRHEKWGPQKKLDGGVSFKGPIFRPWADIFPLNGGRKR